MGKLTAELTEFEGRLGDATFEAVVLRVDGVQDPHIMALAMPRSSIVGLKGKVEARAVYRALVDAVNEAEKDVEVVA